MINWIYSVCTRETPKVIQQRNDIMKSVFLGRSVCYYGGETFGGRVSKIF